jgi:hypothetical protein
VVFGLVCLSAIVIACSPTDPVNGAPATTTTSMSPTSTTVIAGPMPSVAINAPGPPPVHIVVGAAVDFIGEVVTTDGGTIDAEHSSWSFGDGTSEGVSCGTNGVPVHTCESRTSHQFGRPGAYLVTLSGTELGGGTGQAALTVDVAA